MSEFKAATKAIARRIVDQADQTHTQDTYYVAEIAYDAARQQTEREIVAWLDAMKRDDTNWPQVIARMIERGEYRPPA